MPEIKHDFSAGKMNKDLDERIVPNGQYRNAINVQIRTTSSDGSQGNAGTVQNLQGNREIKPASGLSGVSFEKEYVNNVDFEGVNESRFVGSVLNEKENTMYAFLAGPNIDSILPSLSNSPSAITQPKVIYDHIIKVTSENTPTYSPVFNDLHAYIDTGTNVIDSNIANTTLGAGWKDLPVNLGIVDTLVSGYVRPGMLVTFYNSSGEKLIEDSEVWVARNAVGGNYISFYDEQESLVLSDVSYISFIAPRVLRLNNKSLITGINIIDDLLFWTDNEGEPKKINIKRSIAGTPDFKNHTKLKLSNPNDRDELWDFVQTDDITQPFHEKPTSPSVNNYVKEEHITVIRKAPLVAPSIEMKDTDRSGEISVSGFMFDFATYNDDNSSISVGQVFSIPHALDLDGVASTYSNATTSESNDPTIFNNLNVKEGDIIKITEETDDFDSYLRCLVTSVVINDDGYKVISLEVLSINKTLQQTQYNTTGDTPTPIIAGSGFWQLELEQPDPYFELKFGRFGCRYKYEDGEYSNYGPWSEIVFLPGAFDLDHKRGYNVGMANNTRSIKIKDFIPHQRVKPNDMVAVDILYKNTESPNVYVVKTIARGRDPEWDLFTDATADELSDKYKQVSPGLLTGGPTFGELSITSEMIHKALPANQTLRAWDNVPLVAKAQEIAANRLVYGNFEFGYEIKNSPGLKRKRKNRRKENENGQWVTTTYDSDNVYSMQEPGKSLKSMRDYTIGMVFGDKYGRETPIISPGYVEELISGNQTRFNIIDPNLNISKENAPNANQLVLEQLWGQDYDSIPDDWISYVKYYIKETTNEYYNIVMDRWYEAEDGNIWISFASADRNKITEETYLILKNEHGYNTPVLEKARYKVLAIENEAPDFVKRAYKNMGRVEISGPNNIYSLEDYIIDGSTYNDTLQIAPTKLQAGTKIAIGADAWGGFLDGYDNPEGDLEIRVVGVSGNEEYSQADGWRLVTYHHKKECDPDDAECEDNGVGALRWDKPFGSGADMQEALSTIIGQNPLQELYYYLDFREVVTRNLPEFDGKFFVKIERNELLKNKVLGVTAESVDYDVVSVLETTYIENAEYNPSDTNSIENAAMPRRNYKWHRNDAGDVFDPGDDNGPVNAETNLTPGSIVSNVATNWFWWDTRYCRGTSAADGTVGGCHSRDAEYMALGCSDMDGLTNGTYINNPADQDRNQVVYNRAKETAGFWLWYRGQTGSTEGEDAHGVRPFIDGFRAFRTKKINDITSYNEWDNSNYDQDTWTEDGSPYGIGSATNYYKPTGITHGQLSSPAGQLEQFGPTTNTLGRMTMSVLGAWSTDENTNEWKLMDSMTNYGTLFRFANDPRGAIYKVVSASSEIDYFQHRNHAQRDSDSPGLDGGSNSCDWGQWSQNTTYWGFGQFTDVDDGTVLGGWDMNPNYVDNNNAATASSDNCSGTPPLNSQGIENPSGGGSGGNSWVNVNFTNNDPQRITSENPNGFDSVVNGTTGSGQIKAGGSSNASYWWHNTTVCGQCGDMWWFEDTFDSVGNTGGSVNAFSQPWAIRSCVRSSFTFEFRRFDPTVNGLMKDDDNVPGVLGIETDVWDPRGSVCHDGREPMDIEILTGTRVGGEVVIPTKNAAVWETEPTEDVGLDLYYEASNAIPIHLNKDTANTYIPHGCRVDILKYENGTYQDAVSPFTSGDLDNDGAVDDLVTLPGTYYVDHIGHTRDNSVIAIKGLITTLDEESSGSIVDSYYTRLINFGIDLTTDKYVRFYHPDGSTTMAKLIEHMIPEDEQEVGGDTETRFFPSSTQTGYFKLDTDVWKLPVELSWHNCYTFTNGVESDRIRDDYNANTIDNGVKVSTTFIDYGREKRNSGMIYSGIYNSTSGKNNLNEFNMAEKITKDLNPSYGSIQRLKTRDTDMVVLTEDKVLRVITNKDALYNADGNPQLLATNRVLGTATPFSGDYGISQNPESLAWDQYRMYFTDKQRGAVLRLSRDGLTPISDVGMKTYFRDKLRGSFKALGTYDSVNGEYNLTIDDNTTVSFNEESKGWVSFKSFYPQIGGSVSGNYITAISKSIGTSDPSTGIFHHYRDYISGGKVINRNTFYALDSQYAANDYGFYFDGSRLDFLINESPGDIKEFVAFTYEGSQAKIEPFATVVNQTQPDGSMFSNNDITGVMDGEYYNLTRQRGWSVSRIKTDNSSFANFNNGSSYWKQKEGKWYTYVRGGVRTNYLTDEELEEFSVQGIGNSIAPPSSGDSVENITIQIQNEDDNEFN